MNTRSISGSKRDANGNRICKVCLGPLSGRRKSYCSHECFARNWPSIMRSRVYKRDHGICALCGADSMHWEADHIVPVSEGGGLCGLEGYRTLCKKCHGQESGKLRRRLNARKKIAAVQRQTGKLF